MAKIFADAASDFIINRLSKMLICAKLELALQKQHKKNNRSMTKLSSEMPNQYS